MICVDWTRDSAFPGRRQTERRDSREVSRMVELGLCDPFIGFIFTVYLLEAFWLGVDDKTPFARQHKVNGSFTKDLEHCYVKFLCLTVVWEVARLCFPPPKPRSDSHILMSTNNNRETLQFLTTRWFQPTNIKQGSSASLNSRTCEHGVNVMKSFN